MFEYLKDYKQIFVSGPQRSGTTICMRMIQYDIEAPMCVWTGNQINRITEIKEYGEDYDMEIKYPLLFHCPGLSHILHALKSDDGSKSAVIWMKRDPQEVAYSGWKVGWDPSVDLQNYNVVPDTNGVISLFELTNAKERLWEMQKTQIENWFEVEYESLKSHPLWIDKEDRNFGQKSRCTSPGLLEIVGEKPMFWEGGDLESLLKEFPKEK